MIEGHYGHHLDGNAPAVQGHLKTAFAGRRGDLLHLFDLDELLASLFYREPIVDHPKDLSAFEDALGLVELFLLEVHAPTEFAVDDEVQGGGQLLVEGREIATVVEFGESIELHLPDPFGRGGRAVGACNDHSRRSGFPLRESLR